MSSDTPAESPKPTLDAVALSRLRELDPDGRGGVVQRVLSTFESSLTRTLGQLQAARTGTDPAAVAVIAHTLKSGSAAVGALELAAVCADVERRLRSGDVGNVDSDIERLLAAGGRALEAVGSMLRP